MCVSDEPITTAPLYKGSYVMFEKPAEIPSIGWLRVCHMLRAEANGDDQSLSSGLLVSSHLHVQTDSITPRGLLGDQ